ncbi:MAG: thiamine-phosphate kinase [Bacteroidetes bacterium RIFCSPLOWO2_12_FULL_35_15]|nr:MAG: thiamine-phosphate kinase [Bacteroidetes bacterium RIFCSPLOWO2_12_FULL_35_15]
MLENTGRTELSSLGEFGLIKQLTQFIEIMNESSIKGVGDDAAVIDYKGKQTVVSTDMLVEGVHFDLAYVPLKHLGYKAVSVNASDIYAMNAMPKQILVSLAISNRFSVEAMEELYSGIHLACHRHKIDIVGGDTTTSKSGLVISITVLGEANPEDLVYRDGAKEGDLLCVTGDLGGAYVGLQLLEREKQIFMESPGVQPDLEGNDYIIERQLKPEARKDIPVLLQKLEVKPTSMIDISDGLASEVLHLCSNSKVGCSLYEEKIPIDPSTYNMAREFNLDPTVCALSGGEDYELLFTIDQSDFPKIKANPDITIIGHMTNEKDGKNLITKGGTVHPLIAQGWDALLKKD